MPGSQDLKQEKELREDLSYKQLREAINKREIPILLNQRAKKRI
jgi:hypothetical protein